MTARPSIAVFLDSPDERWFAMDLVGEMLLAEWRGSMAAEVQPFPFTVAFPRIARKVPRLADRLAFNIDRAAGRYLAYPPIAALERGRHDFFHVADHSYAHLVHVLPRGRTGLYCHDLDAFRPLLDGPGGSAWRRAIATVLLGGLRSAGVVFFSTHVVRAEIERGGLVDPSRLVHAPYGISPEFRAERSRDRDADAILGPLGGRPFLLHVGSNIPRKRLDVLFETFARLRHRFPDLFLVKSGASLSDTQWALADALGMRDRLVLTGDTSRSALASLYQRANAVLVPSDAEGFGLPVIEALACGAPLFASDIPVLREVGEGAAIYCRAGDPDHWAAAVGGFLAGETAAPPLADRLAAAGKYSWATHARTILSAYRDRLPAVAGRAP